MKELSDIELLDAYATQRSEDAFRELVVRHIDLIYSAAMRQLRNPHLAQEATQSAFIALAGKARQLRRTTVIAGWLHRAVHFAALNLQRGEVRRKHWEEEVASLNVADDADHVFQEFALPHVDGALAELSESDRDAVILRFLKQQSFRDLAQTLGTSEEAAKKRVSRALDKLRGLLAQRGVTVSSAALAGGLSQLPVTGAPPSMSSTVAALAVSSAPSATTIGALLGTAKARVAVGAAAVILVAAALLLWPWPFNQNTTAAANAMNPSIPQINLASVMIDDQDKALKFYTEVLGFVRKVDMPTGEPGGARWLTVVSPDDPDGTELLLEPMGFSWAKVYQKALFDARMPLVPLAVGDIQKQVERLKTRGVQFSAAPTATTAGAVFEDTCGNRIQLVQAPGVASLRINWNTVLVDDQDKALKFYTERVGFVKKGITPFATVASPDQPGAELRLEPLSFAPARKFQQAAYKAGIPATQFMVGDIRKAVDRMARLGVVFRGEPTPMGPVLMVMFDDSCGNLILLLQPTNQ